MPYQLWGASGSCSRTPGTEASQSSGNRRALQHLERLTDDLVEAADGHTDDHVPRSRHRGQLVCGRARGIDDDHLLHAADPFREILRAHGMRQMPLAGRLDRTKHDKAATLERIGIGVHQAEGATERMRDVTGQHASRMKPLPRRLQGGPDLRGMMSVIVHQRDATDLSANFEAPGDALKSADRLDGGRYGYADSNARGQRGKGIAGIVFTWEPRRDHGQDLAFVPGREAHAIAFELDVSSMPVSATPQTIRFDVRSGA